MGYIKKFLQKPFKESKSPEVSIVMPSFNQGRYIEAAIRSVLEQRDQDIELIVVDGGSTDDTLQILEQLMHLFEKNNLIWYSEADRGAAHAINKALSKARAPIIGWLNSDDLYAPDAVNEAVNYFKEHSDILMLYGQGLHINENGEELKKYPTLPPSTNIDTFKDGCFICQPSIFIRRELLDDVGLLDEKLLTAFDFDLWLRVFSRFQKRIGFIDKVLAYSRLHSDCKTMSLRQTVALESMGVLAKHLGSAPSRWVLTYFDELFERYPHQQQPGDITQHYTDMLSKVKPTMRESDFLEMEKRLNDDQRFRLALPEAYINIYPDSWLPPVSFLRVRATEKKWKKLQLNCSHDSPSGKKISIHVFCPWGEHVHYNISRRGKFKIDIELPDKQELPCYWSFRFEVDKYFIPSKETETNDNRELAFRVLSMKMLPN